MGAGAFHGRVRKGNGCSHPAITTRSAKRNFCLRSWCRPKACLFKHVFDLFHPRALVAPIQARGRRQSFGGPSAAPLARQDKGQASSGRPLCGRRGMSTVNENDQADRAISTGKLHALPHFHTRPINVVVFHGSDREHSFSGGFPA